MGCFNHTITKTFLVRKMNSPEPISQSRVDFSSTVLPRDCKLPISYYSSFGDSMIHYRALHVHGSDHLNEKAFCTALQLMMLLGHTFVITNL